MGAYLESTFPKYFYVQSKRGGFCKTARGGVGCRVRDYCIQVRKSKPTTDARERRERGIDDLAPGSNLANGKRSYNQ